MVHHLLCPPIKGVELDGVKTLRTIADADAILEASQHAAKVVCIGGGLLGLEVAGAIAESGGEVVVLEAQPWLLPPRQLDERASQHLQRRIEAQNVRVLLNVQTEAILGDGRVEKCAWLMGGNCRQIWWSSARASGLISVWRLARA